MTNLRTVLQRFRGAILKLSPKKCFSFQREVKYRIATDPEKTETVRVRPIPTRARSFVGLCSYYCRFIAGLADIVQPLYQCMKGLFNWTPECDRAFQKLKQQLLLTEAPILGYPTADDPFVVDTDASLTGVGAVLSCSSHRLSKAESNYRVTRREPFAVIKPFIRIIQPSAGS